MFTTMHYIEAILSRLTGKTSLSRSTQGSYRFFGEKEIFRVATKLSSSKPPGL